MEPVPIHASMEETKGHDMYVGWRDLRWARGRFTLVLGTVVLITVLVGLLTGLTSGLGRESTSMVTALRTDHLVLSSDSFESSSVPLDALPEAEPLGIATVRASGAGGTSAVALAGVRPGSGITPAAADLTAGTAVLTEAAAEDLGVKAGDEMTLGSRTLEVAAVQGEDSYAHQAVVWADLDAWLAITGNTEVNALAVDGDLPTLPRGWHATNPADAVSAIPGYSSEHGSLVLIRVFLLAISALVISAFFTVWTMQRTGDVAVLKALGATNASVFTDAVGQAAVVLGTGIGAGAALSVAIGQVAGQVVPFHLSVVDVLVPAALLFVLGLAGALLAVRSVVRVDPLLALNGR